MQQPAEFVARDAETHAIAGVAQCCVFALVDEDMVHATVGSLLLRMFEQLERGEVDVPVGLGARFRDRARRIGVECRAGLRLGNLAGKTVGRAIRTEAHAGFRGFARLEQTDIPPVG